ncbi:MAG: translocation/assembly module TamB domain-containing protein [Bacteroidota bacterium]
MAKKVKRKIIGGGTLSIILLVLAFFVLIHFPFFQTYLTQQAAKVLSNKIQSDVKVGSVELSFFNHFILKDVYIADDNKDTLIYIGKADANLQNFALFDKKVNITKLVLSNTHLAIGKDKEGYSTIKNVLSRLTAVNPTKKPTKKPAKTWDFAFGELVIEQLKVDYNDKYHNQYLQVILPKGNLAVKSLDLKKNICSIASAQLDGANITFVKEKYHKTADSAVSKNMHFLGAFLIEYENIQVSHSKFSYNDKNKEISNQGIDYFHMGVNDITIQIQKGKIDHDTIFGLLDKLSCTEKSGFALSNLTGNARVSTSDVTIEQMVLTTPNSRLKDYLRLEYDSFPDFKDFIHKVKIKASLNESQLSLVDINYFAKNKLESIKHNIFMVSGNIIGEVDNIRGKNLLFTTGLNTSYEGEIYMNGLPNIKETLINAEIDNLQTDVNDIKRIYPNFTYPTQLQNFGNIGYKGRFDGFISDFVSNGYITSNLGNANTDLNVKYTAGSPVRYSGHLITESFDIGALTDQQNNIGKVSLDATVKGSGLKLNELNATFDGIVHEFELKNYNYKEIKIDGSFVKKEFKGNLNIEDENIKLDFSGQLNLDGATPSYNFDADIEKIDLKALNLSKKNIVISTKSNINFKGKKLDDFNGDIYLNDLVVKIDSGVFPLNNVHVNTYTDNFGVRFFDISSDILKANISGTFSYSKLPSIVRAFINKYSLEPERKYMDSIGNAKLAFSVIIYEPGLLSTLIHKNFTLIRNTAIKGKLDSRNYRLDLEATIPELTYGTINLRQIHLLSNIDGDKVNIQATLGKLNNKDSLILKNSTFEANYGSDNKFNFNLYASMDSSANRAELKGLLGYTLKRVEVELMESDVYVNNKKWSFLANNKIIYAKKYLNTQNLILHQDDKDIYITTNHPNDSTTNLELDLSNISVKDISKLVDQSKNNYFGKADGGLEINDLFRTPKYLSNIYVANLGVNNDTVGNLSIYINAGSLTSKIPIEAKLIGRKNDIRVDGYYEPKPNASNIDLDVKIAKFDVPILNNYLQQYVTEAKGNIWGKVKVSGTNKKPIITGYANLLNCEVTVAYINTRYKLKNEMVRFKENEIIFDNVVIRDKNDSIAIGGGSIKHNYFKDFFFDVNVTSDYFQMLSTTEKQNPIYWGDIYLSKATALFKGPLKNIAIKVYGATTRDSKLTIPIRTTAETGEYSFYRFVNFNDTTVGAIKRPKPKALLNVNIDVDVTEAGELTLILDPASGDRLKVRGNGNIKIGFNDNEQLIVRGDYTISEGNYLFTLQNIINKSFSIDKGSKITFDGSVYDAKLDVDAVYTIRTSPYELIQNLISGNEAKKNIASRRIPTSLILLLNGPLSKPDINFDIKMQNIDNTILQDVETKLNTLRTNPQEMNKQAAALIVINGFFVDGATGSTTSIVSEGAKSTITEFLSTQISSIFNRLLGNFVNGIDVSIQYKNYNNNDASAQLNGNDFAFGVRKGFLNNKLSLNVGGNIDIGQKNNTKNNNYNGDFTLEYQVTNDGRLRLKAYNRATFGAQQEALVQSGNYNSTGFGISYREEFDNLADLVEQWKIRKQERKSRKNQKQAARESKKPKISP